jgi:hypothetical protein
VADVNGLQSGVPTEVVEFEKFASVDAVHALLVRIILEILMLRIGVVEQLFMIE